MYLGNHCSLSENKLNFTTWARKTISVQILVKYHAPKWQNNYKNRPVSQKPLCIEGKAKFRPLGVERVYLQLLALLSVIKVQAQILQ